MSSTDLFLALLIALITAMGGRLIRDIEALAIFVGLSAAAAFLLAFLLGAPGAVLGLMGLSIAAIKIVRSPQVMKLGTRIRTYRSRERLKELEEATVSLSRIHIVDVVPAGSRRAIHPKVVELLELADRATALGYHVEEPPWLRDARLYRRLLGSEFVAAETTVVGETEVIPLTQ
ncbi:MAG: secretion system protein [Pyrobaculum sp.]